MKKAQPKRKPAQQQPAEPSLTAGHAGGLLGERDAAFALGKEGWVCVVGPFGDSGHRLNEHGFDGIYYHPEKKQVLILDNKASGRTGTIRDASALTTNFNENIGDSISSIKALPDFEHKKDVLEGLRAAQKASAQNKPMPPNVIRGVSTAGGYSRGLAEEGKAKGLQDVRLVPDSIIALREKEIEQAKAKGERTGRPMSHERTRIQTNIVRARNFDAIKEMESKREPVETSQMSDGKEKVRARFPKASPSSSAEPVKTGRPITGAAAKAPDAKPPRAPKRRSTRTPTPNVRSRVAKEPKVR